MPNPVDIYVGKRLRLRRTILGLSQQALGKEAGITFQQIQKYERGVNRVGASRLHRFSNVLDVPINFFFDGYDGKTEDNENLFYGMADSKKQDDFSYNQMSSRETMEMMRMYYKINDAQVRRRIFDLVKSLSEDAVSVQNTPSKEEA